MRLFEVCYTFVAQFRTSQVSGILRSLKCSNFFKPDDQYFLIFLQINFDSFQYSRYSVQSESRNSFSQNSAIKFQHFQTIPNLSSNLHLPRFSSNIFAAKKTKKHSPSKLTQEKFQNFPGFEVPGTLHSSKCPNLFKPELNYYLLILFRINFDSFQYSQDPVQSESRNSSFQNFAIKF